MSNIPDYPIFPTLQVKPTVWTAHMNGRKHRDAIEKLKQSLAAPKRQAAPGNVKGPPAKKAKGRIIVDFRGVFCYMT